MTHPRIYLSSPHMGKDELSLVHEAFETNWIAPLGPQVDAFEREFALRVGSDYAVALASGTAGLHLAIRWLDLQPGDEVICSTLTFAASVYPVLYEHAIPVFVDSEACSWNMDPALLSEAIRVGIKRGKKPKAVILVHLYGQSADIDPIIAICAEHEIPVIEDAAEALGATYKGRAPGSFGVCGVYSFNGNKIITTSGGDVSYPEQENGGKGAFLGHPSERSGSALRAFRIGIQLSAEQCPGGDRSRPAEGA